MIKSIKLFRGDMNPTDDEDEVPCADAPVDDERALDSEDLLNYFKKLERAFRRDAGNKVETTGGSRQNCSLEYPRQNQKVPLGHPSKITASTDFRISEGCSKADIRQPRRTNSGRPETNREGSALSSPLFGTFPSEARSDHSFISVLNNEHGVFRIVDDLNSSEILWCEELLNERCETGSPARYRVNARRNHRHRRGRDYGNSRARRGAGREGTVAEGDPYKPANTRRKRERFDSRRETAPETATGHCVENPRRRAAELERPWDRYGNRIEATGKISLETSGARSCEQATRSEYACLALQRLDSRSYLERAREAVTGESDATCCRCRFCRAAFRLDVTANDSTGQLETATRCRKCASIAATPVPSRSRLLEVRSNVPIGTCSNERRFSNSCYERSFREPSVFWKRNEAVGRNSFGDSRGRRVVKPEDSVDKVHLKKVVVYPPRGRGGPPLTLYKSSSNVDCVVNGNPRGGFRYSVTYVQKFQSSFWCPEESD